jgi:hypothetical protein
MYNHKFLALTMAAAATCLSCNSVRPLSPNAQLNDRPARGLTLVVPESCEFTPAIPTVHHTLTAGRYKAELEDNDGIYFQGSHKVFLSAFLGGGTLEDGGVYVGNDGDTLYIFFVNRDGHIERYNLPKSCTYRIERCEDCGDIALR